MIGDVNIFLHGSPPHLHTDNPDEEDDFYAEVEIMIAGMYAGILIYSILSGTTQSVNFVAKDSPWKHSSLCSDTLQRLPMTTFSAKVHPPCKVVHCPFHLPPF